MKAGNIVPHSKELHRNALKGTADINQRLGLKPDGIWPRELYRNVVGGGGRVPVVVVGVDVDDEYA